MESSSSRGSSRKNRVYVFREFLLKTYSSYLRPHDVVLDIAGGKGDLSWLLTNVDGLTSIVVDPRITKCDHFSKSIAYLRAHPDEALKRAIPNRPTHQPLASILPALEGRLDFIPPRHFRILVDHTLLEAVRAVKRGDPEQMYVIWDHYWIRALESGSKANTLGYQEESHGSYHQILNSKEALDLLLSCRLVIGFHPDQATDYCIELADELGIPFTLVPCCVFPAQFPHRRLKDGTKVRDYQGLLCYLRSKAPKAFSIDLHFQETITARNIALYTLP